MSAQQEQLVEFLSKIPLTETFEGRTALLYQVDGHDGFTRSQDNKLLDLQFIVRRICSNRTSNNRLLTNLRGHLGEDDRGRLERLVLAAQTPPSIALHLVAPHNFDLNNLVDECLPKIDDGSGLIGFTLASPCDTVLVHLMERVKDHRSTIGVTITRKFDTVSGLRSLSSAVRQFERLRSVAACQDVVCGVVIADGEAAAELWRGARVALDQCLKRVVLFMLIQSDAAPPPGVSPLPAPAIYRHHVKAWWREVLKVTEWSTARIEDFLDGFGPRTSSVPLDVNIVYDGLALTIDLLKEHADEDLFHAHWAEQTRSWRQGAT